MEAKQNAVTKRRIHCRKARWDHKYLGKIENENTTTQIYGMKQMQL